MRDLTILLALKDREVYTQRWIDQNIFPDFYYVIADGSYADHNQKIFSQVNLENVNYIRFVPDSTYPIYIQKRLKSLNEIKTRFVLYADNDDFLIRDGLNQIMDYLDQNREITLVQGTVGRVVEEKEGNFSKISNWDHHLSNGTAYENIKVCLSTYYSLFYCISETKIQKKIFELFVESGTVSPYLVEEFQTYFSIAMSRPKVLPNYYYIRLANSVGSQDAGFSEKHKFDLCLDQNFHHSFHFLVNQLSSYLPEIDKSLLLEELRQYQISKIKTRHLRLKEHILVTLKSKIQRVTKSMHMVFKKKVFSGKDMGAIFNS